MPLESLENDEINIHDLTLEQEKKPITESERLYEALKETPLYNAEKKLWRSKMNEGQVIEDPTYPSLAQLSGILVEAEFDKAKASRHYEELKKTDLYNQVKRQWYWAMGETPDFKNNRIFSKAQLMGILVESKFDKNEASKKYKDLKATGLFDASRNQWNDFKEVDESYTHTRRYSDAQLLGILIDAHFDLDNAKTELEKLKSTPLYDREEEMWNWCMGKDQIVESYSPFSSSQLLGVLLEAKFDKRKGQEQYRKLKQSPLYDQFTCHWKDNVGPVASDSEFLAHDQLLGILCEREFEEEEPNLQSPTPSLPETRKY